MRTPLQQLHSHYSALSLKDPASLNSDQRRSLAYYEFDIDPALASGGRIAEWVRNARMLDRFVQRERRLPRENNRLDRSQISKEERHLADWLRYQRRPATRAHHSAYQQRRLEAVPGFSWDPIGRTGAARFEVYRAFTQSHRRAPSARSLDITERRIAAWAAKQRFAHRQGRLRPSRVRALTELPIWIWGRSGAPKTAPKRPDE